MKNNDEDDPVSVPAPMSLSRATIRVAQLLLVHGTLTAPQLAEELQLSSVAIRRHLETLLTVGMISESESPPFGPAKPRGRGRPAKYFQLTPIGRDFFDSHYDDLAAETLRYLQETYGDQAVIEFARHRANNLAQRYAAVTGLPSTSDRVHALAALLSQDGFAANTSSGPSSVQLCQHHCPVAHVATEFPQLCDAEREAFSEILDVHVTRLSTLAAGGGVCTTVIPTTDNVEGLRATPVADSERNSA